MSALIRSEIVKLRTTRTFWAMTLGAFALLLLATVLGLTVGDPQPGHDVRDLLTNGGIVALFALVLGALGMTGEYRHGSVTMTFLVAPRRSRVIVAKAVASLASGAVLGLLAVLVNIAVVVLFRKIGGEALGVSVGSIVGIGAGTVAFSALSALLGLGVGAIVRNQVAAIVILLGILFIIDPLLSAIADSVGQWTISGLAGAITGGQAGGDNPPELLSPVVSGLVLLGYGVLVSAIGAALTVRRDVA
jgi:ABC-type transport system involved in multi-copper enzyme maturation permease subunit